MTTTELIHDYEQRFARAYCSLNQLQNGEVI